MNLSNQTYKELAIPYFREVFDQIDEVMSELQVPFYLIGANAIALQLLKQGILPGRSTKDIDFAVMVSDMPQYEQIVAELEKRKFEKISAPWTFYYADKNAVIDILPFGEIAQNDTVRFAKMYSYLHVLGFTEVLQNAEQVHIEEKVIGIPTLPGMVLLKLVAWSDRPEERENDIADILKIIDHYYDLNEEEILDHYHDTFLESEEFDRLKIAAEVLGRKAVFFIRQNEALFGRISGLIETQLRTPETSPIAQRWAQIKGWEISYSVEVLSAFQKGLKYTNKKSFDTLTGKMKLQFKEQDFQVQAVKAIVDCFAGQPLKTNRFTLERAKDLLRKAKIAAAGGAPQAEVVVLEEIGYRNSPIQLSDSQILKNIQAVQQQNDLHESQQIERPKGVHLGYNFTIEMETGTGKTYTYIRTMYDLHKQYGWSKYIVIVPSIAIREGVLKSFEVTQDHFQELYGHKISPFIYNSGRPQDIENFASDSRISVMIINTQAFNANGADARRIYQELDQFGTRKPIDIIAQTNPILIIDEPQSVDGDKTLRSMQDFNPLFTLRYSATHKVEYNKVFRLDALDAYNKRLVKKIQVKGISLKGSTGTTGYLYLEQISLSTTKPPFAVVEFEKRAGEGIKKVRQKLSEGANLYELSGNIPAYKNQTITEINGYLNKVVVGGEDIYPGDIHNDKDESTFRRVQIRECIKSHLQKEKQLFESGVKVLSLFFIDSVEKYRVYDDAGEQALGEYAKIFEEEYNLVRSDFLDLFQQEYNEYLHATDPSQVHRGYMPSSYEEYLKRDEAHRIHEGYFSIDKKGKSIDPTLKKGSEESDDISAYDLIMKDKERLMSFEEPVRFIFSHSALKEGWDNPNVFQICALKNADSGSQTRRRQEVGRGMRLCVNANGNRLDFEAVGDQVHEINKLTVIASESYEAFARGLQQEIAATLKDRPQKAEVKYFVGKVVRNEKEEEYRLTEDDAKKLNKLLYKHDIIDDDDKITPEGRELIEQNKVPLPEKLEHFRDSVVKLLRSVYTGEAFKAVDERQTIVLNTNQNFKKKEFQALWEKINLKSIYEVQFDSEKLIHDSKVRINAQLHIGDRAYEVKTGELQDGTKEQMQEGSLIKESERQSLKLKNDLYTNAVYDIVGEIEVRTHLTRATIVAILKAIKEEKFLLLRKNPEEFIAKCSRLINDVKASLIINNIVYHKIEERHDAKTVFANDKSVLRNAELLKKHIYDYLNSDSAIESDFAKALENSTEVVVYAKLPKSFYISTPVANYSPDWAIVFDKEKVRHIYFVTETKGTDSDMELREIEKLKIHCATEHFKEISAGEVKFEKISSYGKLMDIVQLK